MIIIILKSCWSCRISPQNRICGYFSSLANGHFCALPICPHPIYSFHIMASFCRFICWVGFCCHCRLFCCPFNQPGKLLYHRQCVLWSSCDNFRKMAKLSLKISVLIESLENILKTLLYFSFETFFTLIGFFGF